MISFKKHNTMFDGKEAQIVFVRDVTDSVNFEETLVN